MTLLILLHLVAGIAALTVLGRTPRVATFVGVATMSATALFVGMSASEGAVESWTWMPELGLALTLRLDGFGALMTLVVSVLGALVLTYSSSYFERDETYRRFVGVFVMFAGAMTGLVLAADLFTMFVFWELTSVCSFLLIGLNDRSQAARQSALRALLVTVTGGLCLLAGMALFQIVAGTSTFSELAASPPVGGLAEAAALLVLVGALTKSAQFPFHFWLPGAMAAPTPVSAYLHSATMVKAGIVLVARMAPIVSDQGAWRWMLVVAGGTTMLIGGLRALAQTDAKLLLAHGTVSQLGMLMLLVGIGTPVATYAGVAHLVAHAAFKAALFLGVGVVDHSFGTRDISMLSGVGRRLRGTSVLIVIAAASMAGVIPLFGFATKEKALVALLEAPGEIGSVGVVALVAVVLGSVLSVAYTLRFSVGLLGTKRDREPTPVEHAPGPWLVAPVAIIALPSLVFGFAPGVVGRLIGSPAASLDPDSAGKLVLWPGLGTPLYVSVVVLVVGALLGSRVPLRSLTRDLSFAGERIFDRLYSGLLAGSVRLTRFTQSGSLLVYVAVTMVVAFVAVFVGVVPDLGASLGETFVAHSAPEGVVALATAALAVGMVWSNHRFVSAVLLGAVGFGCAALFAFHGAPDLALTQLLVETLTIVVFLLVLRWFPSRFDQRPEWMPRVVPIAVSVFVGLAAAAAALVAAVARRAPSVGLEYAERSLPDAGGRNVVNVILVDFRAFDTFGEITVLAVAALGVANLVHQVRRRRAAAR